MVWVIKGRTVLHNHAPGLWFQSQWVLCGRRERINAHRFVNWYIHGNTSHGFDVCRLSSQTDWWHRWMHRNLPTTMPPCFPWHRCLRSMYKPNFTFPVKIPPCHFEAVAAPAATAVDAPSRPTCPMHADSHHWIAHAHPRTRYQQQQQPLSRSMQRVTLLMDLEPINRYVMIVI